MAKFGVNTRPISNILNALRSWIAYFPSATGTNHVDGSGRFGELQPLYPAGGTMGSENPPGASSRAVLAGLETLRTIRGFGGFVPTFVLKSAISKTYDPLTH